MNEDFTEQSAQAIWAEITPYKPRIDEGKYQATVKDVGVEWNQLGKYGYKDLVIFQFQIDDVVLKHTIYCTPKEPGVLNLNTKRLKEAVSSILGKEPGSKFNLRDLVGKSCELWVLHVSGNNGNVFERIDKIRPAKSD